MSKGGGGGGGETYNQIQLRLFMSKGDKPTIKPNEGLQFIV